MPPCPPEVYAYVNQHEHRECRFRYQKLIPEIIGTKLHVRCVRNRVYARLYCDTQ